MLRTRELQKQGVTYFIHPARFLLFGFSQWAQPHRALNRARENPSMSVRSPKFWIMAMGVAVVALGAGSYGVKATSTTEFCLSCHEMKVYQKELEASPHAKDAKGNPIGCSQCHVPGSGIVRMVAAKTYLGVKDIWVHTTEEDVVLNRAAMQPMARRFVDDANCRACHQDLGRNAKNDGPVSELGKLAHDNFEDKNGSSRSGCAGCHQNMAHLPPFDRRLAVNAKFAAKLKEARP